MFKDNLFEEALIFAATNHKNQKRKGNKLPYIIHPMWVANVLMKVKQSRNMVLLLTVCLLHDTVEDCGVQIETIAKLFGYQVAALVEELTLDKTQYEKIGKKEYLAIKMSSMSSYGLTIKLCDRFDNIEDMKSMNQEFILNYISETRYILSYIRSMRKFTKTQLKLVELIETEMLKYESVPA